MRDLVNNPEDRFFHNEAHLSAIKNLGLTESKLKNKEAA